MTFVCDLTFWEMLVDYFFVNPGKDAKNPLSIVDKRVDLSGNPRDA